MAVCSRIRPAVDLATPVGECTEVRSTFHAWKADPAEPLIFPLIFRPAKNVEPAGMGSYFFNVISLVFR